MKEYLAIIIGMILGTALVCGVVILLEHFRIHVEPHLGMLLGGAGSLFGIMVVRRYVDEL